METYIIGFAVAVFIVVLGYWLDGQPPGWAWCLLGFTSCALLREMSDSVRARLEVN